MLTSSSRLARKATLPLAVFGLLAVLACIGYGNAAIASEPQKLIEPVPASAVQPLGSSAYDLDPTFNGGQFFLDRFAGQYQADFRGRKLVQLSNGDVVVAGLVPPYGEADQPDGYANIGLVRYNAAGVRVAWAFQSIYGNFNNNYLVYPGSQSSGQLTPRFSDVKDIKVIGNRIYVLVDHVPVGGNFDTQLLIFSDEADQSGRFLGHYGLQSDGFNDVGAAMLAYGSNIVGQPYKLVVATTVYGGSGNYVNVRRFNIGGANTFELDTSFGTDGVTNIFLRQDAGGCAANTGVAGSCPIIAYSIAAGFRGLTGTLGPIYIGAERQYSPTTSTLNDWDVTVIQLSANGALQTGFGAGTGNGGGNGFAFVQFDRGTYEDRNRGITVRTLGLGIPASPYHDEIFAVASAAQTCASGIGIGKLDGDGHYVTSFGSGGKMRFGGWDDPSDAQACAVYGPATPYAVARDSGTLVIAGQDDFFYNQNDSERVPLLAIVNADNGALIDRGVYAITPPGNSFPGAGVLYGVVSSGSGRFSVAGDQRDPSTNNTLMFATGRIAFSDAIFSNGFEPF